MLHTSHSYQEKQNIMPTNASLPGFKQRSTPLLVSTMVEIHQKIKKLVKHKNQAGWWVTTKKEFHPMETKGVWEIVLLSSMPADRKVVGNS
jgi:hypothetical protein